MLVHIPLLIEAGLLQVLVVVGLNLRSFGSFLQRHIPQQARHHDSFIHVVGGRDETVHHIDEGVLVAGRVVDYLHHLEGCFEFAW